MLNPAAKLLLALSGVALALGSGYIVGGGDRTGVVLLFCLALASLVAGLATVGSAVPDRAPVVPADAPPPAPGAAAPGPAPRGSVWPAAAAAAVTLLAAGAAVGVPVVVAGVLAVLVATAGWFARVWSEHPSWTRPVRQRVSTRFLVPVGLPVAAFLLAVLIAVSFSRILLAVSERAAVLLAFVLALAILVGCWWVASRPRMGSSVLVALSVLAATSTVGAGIAGAVSGERHFEPHHREEKALHISAQALKFDKDTLTVPARQKVVVEFDNKDPGTYHNVAVYAGEGPDAPPIFNGEGFPGRGELSYEIETPDVGTYVFICDFHPNQMKGKFVTAPS